MEKIFSLNQINKIASELTEIIKKENITVIAFYGKMGAGKTTLIKQLCQQLGVIDVVQSPTFAIINVYQTRDGEEIYHFDFYRLQKIEDAINIGSEDYFYSGNLCLIEWPEIVEPLLPDNTLTVQLEIIDENTRKISIGNV